MRRMMEEAMQVDVNGVFTVMESFFWKIANAREIVDVNIAAGAALEELRDLGKIEASLPAQH